MLRPSDVRNDNIVDAVVLAGAGSEIERAYAAPELSRLGEAGVGETSNVRANLKFSEFGGKPVISGHLTGSLVLLCQRCMNNVTTRLDETFQVLIADEERADEPGGYEPVIANPTRLDLRWLIEDQTLLALPLVAMHAPGECEEHAPAEVKAPEQDAAVAGQKPFQNLREMMRKR